MSINAAQWSRETPPVDAARESYSMIQNLSQNGIAHLMENLDVTLTDPGLTYADIQHHNETIPENTLKALKLLGGSGPFPADETFGVDPETGLQRTEGVPIPMAHEIVDSLT